MWDKVITQIDALQRRIRPANALLQNYVVEETAGNNETNKYEMWRMFYSTLDHVVNEINFPFSQRNSKLCCYLCALTENINLLDVG